MSDRFDGFISVDDHVIEPPHTWVSRLPARYRDMGPRIVHDADGEAWHYQDVRVPTFGLHVKPGRTEQAETSPLPVTFAEMRPGCYEPVARVGDMDQDGVWASICFPTFPRFCGQQFLRGDDRELARLCVEAYNDFIVEEWCGAAPGRLVPLMILPLWDPLLAVAEMQRNAARGVRAFSFSENPHKLGLPSIHDADGYWEPVWAAAADTGMVVCCHTGSSSQLAQTSPDAPFLVSTVLGPMNAIMTCVDWLLSGVFERHPQVKLCLSEGGIGWMPYVLERVEQTLRNQAEWSGRGDFQVEFTAAGTQIQSRPAAWDPTADVVEVFRDHVFGCFIDDVHGARFIEEIGADNVMVETDYPHSDSVWPHSRDRLRVCLAGHRDDVVERVLRTNASRLFGIELPASVPV